MNDETVVGHLDFFFLVEKSELIKAQESNESLKPVWNEAKRLDELGNEYVGLLCG